jgi:hypothetical protein
MSATSPERKESKWTLLQKRKHSIVKMASLSQVVNHVTERATNEFEELLCGFGPGSRDTKTLDILYKHIEHRFSWFLKFSKSRAREILDQVELSEHPKGEIIFRVGEEVGVFVCLKRTNRQCVNMCACSF